MSMALLSAIICNTLLVSLGQDEEERLSGMVNRLLDRRYSLERWMLSSCLSAMAMLLPSSRAYRLLAASEAADVSDAQQVQFALLGCPVVVVTVVDKTVKMVAPHHPARPTLRLSKEEVKMGRAGCRLAASGQELV
nr:hypothetical protein BaRGS_005430 [Batillaria attramentaria]